MSTSVEFWDLLAEEDKRAVAEAGIVRRFVTGNHLFLEGEPASTVIVIRRGRLKLTRTSLTGKTVLIEMRGPGQLVGELSVIDHRERSAAATAITTMDALVIPAERFRALLRDRGTIGLAVLQSVTARLRESVDRRLESGTGDVLAQLCGRLGELADDLPVEADGTVDVNLPLTQQELAEWIGTSRDAVVLALQRLRQANMVETSRRRIRILDLDAIREAAVE